MPFQIIDELSGVRFVVIITGGPWFLIRIYITDVRGPQSDRDGNRCHADAPFSDRFRLRVHRRVRHSLYFLSWFHAQCGLCCFRTHENRPLSSLVFSKTKRTDPTPTTLDQIKVSVNRASELLSTGPKNDGNSSTGTVVSTSEKMPQITGDPESV